MGKDIGSHGVRPQSDEQRAKLEVVTERKCMRCGAPITKSDGGVLARDLIAFHEGRIKGTEMRETCGLCVLRPDAVNYLEQIP